MVAAVARPPRPSLASPAPRPRAVPREQRAKARRGVALRAWACADEGSKRGYVLDLSETGARIGGMGTSLKPGARVVLKIVLDEREPPVVVRAEIARYHVVVARSGPGCPELCARFVDVPLDEWFRIARFLDARAVERG